MNSPYFDNNSFCQFHCQPRHDTETCFALKCKIRDLIDNNTISLVGVNNKVNKFVAPPNQNLKIFTEPFPSHTSNVIETKHTSFSPNDLSSTQNVVNVVEKQEKPKDFCITFYPSETISTLDGPLCIVLKIQDISCRGVLIDPSYMLNLITKEFLYTL